MSKFLEFRLLRDTGKTKVFDVLSKRQGNRLATIGWYGPWRQYVLSPCLNTVWNGGCLKDVMDFMANLMAERKRSK